jgi:hypothetical protein
MQQQQKNKLSIKEKLEKGIYLLENAPLILEITGYEGIFQNKKLPYPSEIDSFEQKKFEKVRTGKLKVMKSGDWELCISMIKTIYFENREKLDELLVANTRLATVKSPHQSIKRISMQKALDYLGTQLWICMDYYVSNRNELETDLMRQVSDSDLKDQTMCKRLEQELFYKQMLSIFGSADVDDTLKPEDASIVDLSDDENQNDRDDHDDQNEEPPKRSIKIPYSYDKAFMLNDFHKYLDSNYMYASARRGDYYFLFQFAFS